MNLPRFVTGLGVTAVGAETAISAESINLLSLLAAGIGTVVMAMTWLERRQEKKIKEHEATEFARQDMRDRLDAARHEGLLREISHVKELVEVKGELRALRQEVRQSMTPAPEGT